MPGFAGQLAAFATKTMGHIHEMVRLTILDIGGRVVMELSPVGDPALWQRLPSAEYHPGRFRSNWNYGLGGPDRTTTFSTGITTLNGLDALPAKPAGLIHYISNSLPYAQALEYGHSTQAPAGIIAVIAIEMPGIAEANARRLAA